MKVEPSPINMLIIVIAIRTGTIIGLPLQPIVALHQHDCMTKNNIIFIIIITAKDVLELRKVRHQQSVSEKKSSNFYSYSIVIKDNAHEFSLIASYYQIFRITLYQLVTSLFHLL